MKHIGIVGITAEGSALCYRLIVSKAAELFGTPVKHPEITIHNFSFDEYFTAGPTEGEGWSRVHDKILLSIEKLKVAGSDFIIIPANTIHHDFKYLEKKSTLPIINMIDIVVNQCGAIASKKVGVLGTYFTMTGNLYRDELSQKGIETVVPNEEECRLVHSIITNDLLAGKANKNHTNILMGIIKNMNCDSIILACTELPLVIGSEHTKIPIINSTQLLANKALEYACT